MTALVTAQTIKDLLGGTISSTDDAILATLAAAASTFVVSTLGFDPISTAYDEYQNGNDRNQIAIDNPNVISIQSVSVFGVAIPASTINAGAMSSGYVYDKDGIVSLSGYLFTKGFQNVRIQYTAGYATYPADLSLAAAEIAALRFKTRQTIGIQSKTLANETIVFTDKDMTASAKSVIQNYQRTILS